MKDIYVNEPSGSQDHHCCLDDGVSVLPNGALVLVYDRDDRGLTTGGMIFAPGAWKSVIIEESTE